jgi:enamine deaminase RidA (YjgF/YER057c/UK114 family)
MPRQDVLTGTPWEALVGYARAVRLGDTVHVSGTTATSEQGEIVASGDPYGQTVQIIRNIQMALRALGADLEDWQQVGKAHGEFFASIRPASTLVEVSRLVAPEMLVEIEADAIVLSHREQR